GAGHDEADDGPDGLVGDPRHHLGGLEPPVLLARAQGDPADGLAAEVADEAGDAAALHEAAHGVADAAPDLPVLGVRHPVVHAVAALGHGAAARPEDGVEI